MLAHNSVVTVFGGSGFIGTQLVQHLARRGYRVRVAVRRPDLAGHVRPLGAVGQVTPIQANVRNLELVRRAVQGAAAVINLVGIGYESGKQRFRAVHTMGARNVAQASAEAGVGALAHMSALGADLQSASVYSRTKALGEAEVLAQFPKAVILRPSVAFGPGDEFFNLLGTLARMLPVVPVIGAKTKFQPVYVGDIAEAFVAAIEGRADAGKVYELGGPDVETHRALMERVLRETQRSNMLVNVTGGIGKLIALPFAFLPFKPLITGDMVERLLADNVVSDAASRDKHTLAGLGIAPTAMDAVLESYMWRFCKHGQFDRQTA